MFKNMKSLVIILPLLMNSLSAMENNNSIFNQYYNSVFYRTVMHKKDVDNFIDSFNNNENNNTINIVNDNNVINIENINNFSIGKNEMIKYIAKNINSNFNDYFMKSIKSFFNWSKSKDEIHPTNSDSYIDLLGSIKQCSKENVITKNEELQIYKQLLSNNIKDWIVFYLQTRALNVNNIRNLDRFFNLTKNPVKLLNNYKSNHGDKVKNQLSKSIVLNAFHTVIKKIIHNMLDTLLRIDNDSIKVNKYFVDDFSNKNDNLSSCMSKIIPSKNI